ncbi:MAG: hypothetical protein P1P85_02820 [Patescibacteria group bacterium]|nr:hypothetical protein [Patescibacteria group bacterium]
MAIFLILLCVMIAPVSAKTYYTFAGHDAVRYEHSDISLALRPFVDHIEYDIVCSSGAGARLYFTDWGKTAVVLSKPC